LNWEKGIARVINNGVAREESLIKSYKEVLDLYQKQKPRKDDIQTVQLRPWQAELKCPGCVDTNVMKEMHGFKII